LAVLEAFEDSLRAAFAAVGGALVRPRADLLHVLEPEGDTFISAVSVPAAAQAGAEPKPICMMTVTALLKNRPRLTDGQVNACNRYAGLSFLSRASGPQEVMSANSFTVYDDPVQRSQMLYLALQTAVLQRTWQSQVLTALEDDFRQPVGVLDPQSAAMSSNWTDEELASMFRSAIDGELNARQPDAHGVLIHLSKSKVRGQGSFVIVRNDLPHPFYGNGLSVTLVLPEEKGVSQEEFASRALAWNRREALSVMPTPCVGAWSSMLGRPQMQLQCFVPNVVYAAGVGQLVLDSAIQRWAVSGETDVPL